MRPAPVPLTHGPTPLEPLDRLSESLGGPRLFVKRDDQTGLALGGNKARKLEHLCAEALAQGCDTLVTGGGPQSNHCLVVADGSGGTHAGLLAGLDAGTKTSGTRVLGIDVGTRPDLDERVPELAAATAAATDRPAPTGEIHIDHTRFGAGYGKPTPECLEALRMTARLEGLILDPVYTGKAMAGLIGWIREGRFTDQHSVLFWHTGGAPALFAGPYREWLTNPA